ncbi:MULTISPECIES: UDP-N-acetylmuramoyl-L-alanyl-D-glutamate--2,6-diaminopimelate ligase [Cyanobium]|uniref:UDP-N-acetylmuramoyl-L-alanyl-D-glutamate--2,6-diaminopimelate ligase n=1 Tax=Cyanobium usitatum str. Tous TaxID=2116684 RepID=A0A2P7N177_9CYAN|nr:MULTISPECIES: UDP-N-acetylmuramoyl-L-alanyl-D-glutamate--2,6-diaminopimelate ligase [Cyanobium]MCP9779238.1 UDP-N-acetylmuramoyl-L-alanyl-D-glutamate--2,6-diaminopimelate ligase [Cyanobium sp. To12R1]PSJ07235.1 UDP-N-acetylmuramoyl-L-alanyl-D-glutamate--2,6-diaminopimelate ligase [Cyanobium usitatum str. Tous]
MTQLLHQVLQQVGLEVPLGVPNGELSGISCDSRRIGRGTLFLGLPGTQVDGGCFWPQALQAGAVAAVISEAAAALQPPGPGDAVLVAPEPLTRWAGELAAAFWSQPSRRLALIGVTGTNGKTTTTYLIEHLAVSSGRPSALFGTLVNRWPGHSVTAQHTTAFADLLQAQLAQAVEAGAQIGAMEVSSHALDQQRVAGCHFSGAVFTNLTQDHLDYHPSMQAYFEAKARLFAEPLLAGGAVVNGDDPWGAQLVSRLGKACWRSSLEDPSAELFIRDLQLGAGGVRGVLQTPAGEGAFHSPLLGRFNLMNLLQAVGALVQQGVPLPQLLEGLADFRGVPGRMERVVVGDGGGDPAVLVDYAHTPDGLANALAACRPFTAGRLICVFGCGGDRDRSKRPQMGAIAAQLADQLYVTSDNPRTEDAQQILADVTADIPPGGSMQVQADRAVAIAAAIAEAEPGDLVLIAGKGHEDYQILGTTKVHFDDREEADKALRRRRGT